MQRKTGKKLFIKPIDIMKKLKAEFNSLIANESEIENTTSSFHKKYFFTKIIQFI